MNKARSRDYNFTALLPVDASDVAEAKAVQVENRDRQAYDSFYADHLKPWEKPWASTGSPEAYAESYRRARLSPYWSGGTTKGYVRGLAVRRLEEEAARIDRPRQKVHVLDAGCGAGELSVYLAVHGFRVTGVDVSESALRVSQELAERIGVSDQCVFLTESLEDLSLPDDSIDFVIGLGTLHHFIKYEGVPGELSRIMRGGGWGFFADSFGEFRGYRIFHDKEKMNRFGDVVLSRKLILDYFRDFEVKSSPTDWFVMWDKLARRLLPKWTRPLQRRLSRVWFTLDRMVPARSRLALYLSGSVLTEIRRPLRAVTHRTSGDLQTS